MSARQSRQVKQEVASKVLSLTAALGRTARLDLEQRADARLHLKGAFLSLTLIIDARKSNDLLSRCVAFFEDELSAGRPESCDILMAALLELLGRPEPEGEIGFVGSEASIRAIDCLGKHVFVLASRVSSAVGSLSSANIFGNTGVIELLRFIVKRGSIDQPSGHRTAKFCSSHSGNALLSSSNFSQGFPLFIACLSTQLSPMESAGL